MANENRILPPDLFGPPPTPAPKKAKPQKKTAAKKTAKKQAASTVKVKADIKPAKKIEKKEAPIKKKKNNPASPARKTQKPKPKKVTVEKINTVAPEVKRDNSAPAECAAPKEPPQVGDFPWESDGKEAEKIPCPACDEPVYPDSTACIHCGAQFITCPHCCARAAALYNPKMATEQRLNKIFKQYTLFSLALPALPMQDILDCSNCRQRVILCEQCRAPMKVGAEICPSCGYYVRRTKLLINPFSIFDSIFRKKPDMGKAFVKAIEDIMRTLSEW